MREEKRKVGVSVRGTIAMVKQHDQSSLERKGVYLAYNTSISRVIIKGSQDKDSNRNLNGGADAYSKLMLTDLLSLLSYRILDDQPRLTIPTPGWVLQYQSVKKKNVYCLILRRHFLN